MGRNLSPYVEIEWTTEPMNVEELALMHRLAKGDVEAGVSLLIVRSDGRLNAAQIRQAGLDSWSKWVAGMKRGIDVSNAPEAARQVEAHLRGAIQLPSNMRLAERFIEVVDDAPAPEAIDIDKLLRGLDLGDAPDEPQA